jgi:hypothetical protein
MELKEIELSGHFDIYTHFYGKMIRSELSFPQRSVVIVGCHPSISGVAEIFQPIVLPPPPSVSLIFLSFSLFLQ